MPSVPAQVRIRSSTKDDYAALADVLNSVYVEYPTTADELRHSDEHRAAICKHGRWVAERDGQAVGVAWYDQWPDMYHPRKFSFGVTIRPEDQEQGIGTALYDHLLEMLGEHRPLAIRTGDVREDMERGRRFLADRGFREELRGWESRLDLTAFDPTPYAGAVENVRAQGIEMRTLRELQAKPGWERKLYDLVVEIERDVPQPEPYTQPTFEQWLDNRMTHPNLLPDGWFVAVDGDEYVGESVLWGSQAEPNVQVGLTGVRRAYRRRGIALALKVRSITWAKERGYPRVRTWNESTNRPMLAINERLGFEKQPAWIEYVKEFPDSASLLPLGEG